MTIMADHMGLSAAERRAMSEGELYGRRLYAETEARLNADLKADPSAGFDPKLMLDTFATAAKSIEPTSYLRVLAGVSAREGAAWALGAENTFLTEVRVMWRELLRALAVAHPSRADFFLEQEASMMELTQRAVLPHRPPPAPVDIRASKAAQAYIDGARLLVALANRELDRPAHG